MTRTRQGPRRRPHHPEGRHDPQDQRAPGHPRPGALHPHLCLQGTRGPRPHPRQARRGRRPDPRVRRTRRGPGRPQEPGVGGGQRREQRQPGPRRALRVGLLRRRRTDAQALAAASTRPSHAHPQADVPHHDHREPAVRGRDPPARSERESGGTGSDRRPPSHPVPGCDPPGPCRQEPSAGAPGRRTTTARTRSRPRPSPASPPKTPSRQQKKQPRRKKWSTSKVQSSRWRPRGRRCAGAGGRGRTRRHDRRCNPGGDAGRGRDR